MEQIDNKFAVNIHRLCDKSLVVSINYFGVEPHLFGQFYNSIIIVDAAIKALNILQVGP